MHQQQLNISSVQKDLPKLMDLVIRGDEIIITKSDIPIAKISPITEKVSYSTTYLQARSIEKKKSFFRCARILVWLN